MKIGFEQFQYRRDGSVKKWFPDLIKYFVKKSDKSPGMIRISEYVLEEMVENILKYDADNIPEEYLKGLKQDGYRFFTDKENPLFGIQLRVKNEYMDMYE